MACMQHVDSCTHTHGAVAPFAGNVPATAPGNALSFPSHEHEIWSVQRAKLGCPLGQKSAQWTHNNRRRCSNSRCRAGALYWCYGQVWLSPPVLKVASSRPSVELPHTAKSAYRILNTNGTELGRHTVDCVRWIR